MKVTFLDLEEIANPLNGSVLNDTSNLKILLSSLATTRAPFFCELEGSNGYKLTIGLGNVGCVQYSRTDVTPPYLMAIDQLWSDNNTLLAFLAGGTLSEVPSKFSLSFDLILEIASYFLQTGQRSRAVSWEPL